MDPHKLLETWWIRYELGYVPQRAAFASGLAVPQESQALSGTVLWCSLAG